jgi:hypothetical protein
MEECEIPFSFCFMRLNKTKKKVRLYDLHTMNYTWTYQIQRNVSSNFIKRFRKYTSVNIVSYVT